MDRYIRQLYGGNPPSMDYYRQMGQQKSMNTFAKKEAERLRKEAEKNREKQAKEAEKLAADQELLKLTEELRPRQNQTEITAPPPGMTTKPPKQPGGFRRSIDDLVEGGKAFGQAINPFDDVSMNQAFQNFANRERPEEAQNVARGMHRTVDSMTFGAMGGLDKRLNDREPFYRDQRAFGDGGGADMIYDLVGSLVPGAGIAGALRGAGLGANISKGMSVGQKALQRGKEGVMAGALYGGSEAAVNEAIDPNRRTAMEHAQNIGMETLFGGIADPALGGLGDLLGTGLRRGAKVSFDQPQVPDMPTAVREPVAPPQRTPDVRNVLADPIVPDTTLPRNYQSPGNYRPELEFNTTQLLDTNNTPEVKQQKLAEILPQKQQVEQQINQTKESFIDDILDSYGVDRTPEKQLVEADMEWQNIKQRKQEYKEVLARTEKFTIPQELAEEYGNIIPRSFVDKNSSVDIYKAAEMAGYSGDPQGVDEFAHYLRSLQESTKTRKMDVTPEIDPKKLEDIEKAKEMAEILFEESDEFQSLKSTLDALEADLASLQGPNAPQFNVNVKAKDTVNPLDDIAALQKQQPVADADPAPTRKPEQVVDPTIPDDLPPGEQIDWGNRKLDKPETIMGRFNRFLEKFSDRGRAVKVVERQIADAVGKANDAYKNAYRDWRLVPGAAGAGEQYLTKNLLAPMQQLEKDGMDLQEAWTYVVNLQLKRVKELDPEYVLPGENMTEAHVNGLVEQLGKNDLNKQFATHVQKVQRDMLDMMQEAGILSKKQKESLIEQYPDYIPLFRQKGVQTVDDFMNIYTTGNVRKVLHEMKGGSQDLIADPLGNLNDYVMNAHQAIFTNKALKHVSSLEGVKINGHSLAKDVTANPDKANTNLTVKFKDNGTEKTYELTPDLYRAYNQLKTVMEPHAFVRFVEGVGKVQRQSITANPIFTIRQIARDIPEAYINGNFSLFKDLLPATLDMMSGGKLKGSMLDEFYKHGAGYGNIVSMDRTSNAALKRAALRMKKDKNIKDVGAVAYQETLGKLFDKLRRFNEATENLPKLAQFRATARKTGDLDQAAFDARDLMDFAMSGSYVQKANRTVAFLNANIRGKERFARSLKDRPLETLGKAAVVGGGMSAMAYMAYDTYASPKQREIMESVPEWMRQTYWLFPDPTNESNLIRIPKPYETGIISSTPIEFALWNEHLVGTDVKDYILNWATESFLIDPMLNPVTPLIESAANRDIFTGRDITNPRESHLEPGKEGDVYTPFTAEKIGDALNVNPRRIEHLMKGYAPTSSENINVLIDRIAEMTGARENQRPAGTSGGPENFFNPFSMKGGNFQSDRIGDIYQGADEAQALKKRTQQEEGELFQFPNAYRAINQIKTQDQDMAGTIRDIDNDPNLDRHQKQQLREELIAQRNEFANRQVTSGRTDVNEENLSALENEFAGLGAKTTKTDVKAVLVTRLQERGIPKHVIDQVMKMDLTDAQLADAVRRLLEAS